MEVTPLSMSLTPTLLPAVAPVTRSLLPLTVVPSCLGPLELVSSGLARSQRPVVAVSVPLGLVVQPWLDSKSSKKMVPPEGVVGVGVGGAGVFVAVGSGVLVAVGAGVFVDVGSGVLVAVGTSVLVAVAIGVLVAVATGVLVAVGNGVFVAVGTGVFVDVGRGVFVAVGTGVLVAVGAMPTVQTSRLQPFKLPPSRLALSSIVNVQVPLAFWPSNADSGLLGWYVPPPTGGHGQLPGAASSSRFKSKLS